MVEHDLGSISQLIQANGVARELDQSFIGTYIMVLLEETFNSSDIENKEKVVVKKLTFLKKNLLEYLKNHEAYLAKETTITPEALKFKSELYTHIQNILIIIDAVGVGCPFNQIYHWLPMFD